MKKIKCEISKIFYFPLFIVSCVGIVVVCLLSECYVDGSNRVYTVIEMMIDGANIDMLNYIGLNSLEVWKTGLGVWSYLLLPLLLSIGYLSVLATERQSGAIRQVLIREDNFSYCLSKIVSACLYSGVLLAVGYILYGLIVWGFFPSLSLYNEEEVAMYLEYSMPDGVTWFVAKRIIGIFLYGIFLNFYAVGVAIFSGDRYILMCLPMMLSYIYSQAVTKIEYDAFSRNDFVFADKLQSLRLENIIDIRPGMPWVCTLLLMVIAFIVLLGLFWLMITKRGDSGGWT